MKMMLSRTFRFRFRWAKMPFQCEDHRPEAKAKDHIADGEDFVLSFQ